MSARFSLVSPGTAAAISSRVHARLPVRSTPLTSHECITQRMSIHVARALFEQERSSGSVSHLAGSNGNQKSRSEEHTSELQSRENLVCRLLLEKKKRKATRWLTRRVSG